MATITEQEDRLFARWRADVPSLVADGLVDEMQFAAQRIPVLVVLKDVNDRNGGGWDLRAFLRDGARPQTWDNVTRWVRGIAGLPTMPTWSAARAVDVACRRDWLSRIAAVNIKKSPGAASANDNDLWLFASKNREYLREQFDLYAAAKIVICGGSIVAEAVRQLELVEPFTWLETARGIQLGADRPMSCRLLHGRKGDRRARLQA